MGIGAATRVEDNVTEMTAANANTLDDGINVYQSPADDLAYRVSAGTVLLQGPGVPTRFDFAAVVADQTVNPSVTTYVYLDQDGALTQNETGFPASPHIPLAEVASVASTIDSITDRRARLALPGSTDSRLWVTGNFYGPRDLAPSTTDTLTADTLYGLPFPIHGDQPVDRIAVEVTTADAGSSIRLGLYAESTTTRGEPGAKLEDLGTVSGASTGIKSLVISPSRRLAPGRYFVALISSSAVVAFRAIAQADGLELGWPGSASTFQGTEGETRWRGSAGGNPAASALPSTFPATPVAEADVLPFAALRAA